VTDRAIITTTTTTNDTEVASATADGSAFDYIVDGR
jgi:hypothetical protein